MKMRFLYLPDMQHHPSINHGFCQWSIPQDVGSLIFKAQLCKDYNIRMRYGCVNFMAECPKIFFFKWSFFSTEFSALYLRHLSKLTHYDEIREKSCEYQILFFPKPSFKMQLLLCSFHTFAHLSRLLRQPSKPDKSKSSFDSIVLYTNS